MVASYNNRDKGGSADLSLMDILSDPEQLVTLPPGEQAQIVRQARNAALLGYLEARIDSLPLPQKLADQLLSARVHADFYDTQIKWEIRCVERILGDMEGPVVLLKGAAYKALDLGLAQGRLASDVDLLVPKSQLPKAEKRLIAAGWEPMKADEYEQHYYRQWMHELPPLQHEERGTIIDLHHNILPPTARLKPEARKLIDAACPMLCGPLYTLSEEDTLLHRCTHLFFDGDMHNCQRELLDIHGLLGLYLEDHPVSQLVERAEEMGLCSPLYYALYFCHELLATEISKAEIQALRSHIGVFSKLTRSLMRIQLRPGNLGSVSWLPKLANWLLFARSHWLRMPPLMLARHLIRQAWSRGGLKTG